LLKNPRVGLVIDLPLIGDGDGEVHEIANLKSHHLRVWKRARTTGHSANQAINRCHMAAKISAPQTYCNRNKQAAGAMSSYY